MPSYTLTPSPYVNSTNSSMGPLTSSSQATFQASNAAPTPVNPTTGSGSHVMKGGYNYRKQMYTSRRNSGRSASGHRRRSSMSSSLAMIGGKKRRRTRKNRKGSRKNKRRTHRRMSGGGMNPFPTGYSVGGPLPPGNLTAAMAAGGYAVPYYSS